MARLGLDRRVLSFVSPGRRSVACGDLTSAWAGIARPVGAAERCTEEAVTRLPPRTAQGHAKALARQHRGWTLVGIDHRSVAGLDFGQDFIRHIEIGGDTLNIVVVVK